MNDAHNLQIACINSRSIFFWAFRRIASSCHMACNNAMCSFSLYCFLYFVRLIHNQEVFYEDCCFAVPEGYHRSVKEYF